MRIAIDIDCTLHHYWDQFEAAAKRRFGVELPYEEQLWDIDRLRPEQVRACVAETHSDEQILAAEPYPGAVETVRAWHEAGHFIHITSHRHARRPRRHRRAGWSASACPTTSSTAPTTRSPAAARSGSTC